MFGNSRRIDSLEREVSTLREYIVKLTNDVNVFAGNKNVELKLIGERIAKLEEK
jgi:archaellum component FlaC